MAKPIISVDELEWASSSITDPGSGEANKIVPTGTKQTNGWVSAEEPPFNYFNYWQNLVWQYMTWLTDKVEDTGVPIFSESISNELVVPAFTIGEMCAASTQRIVHFSNNGIQGYKLLNSTWAADGTPETISNLASNQMDCSALEPYYVAFVYGVVNGGDEDAYLAVYFFNLFNWVIVASLNIATVTGSATNPTVAALSSTLMAVIVESSETLQTYELSGNTLTAVGNAMTLTGIENPKVTALSSTEIAMIDTNLEVLRKLSWDGTDWTEDGNSSLGAMGVHSISALDGRTVVLSDTTNQEFRAYKYISDSSSWEEIGNQYSVLGEVVYGISCVSGNNLTYANSTDEKIHSIGINWGPERPIKLT